MIETFGKKSKFENSNKEFTKNKKTQKKIKLRVLCNYSCNNKSLYFTNYLKYKDLSTNINTSIFDILNANEKEFDDRNVLFDFSDKDPFLRHNKDKERIPAILNLYSVKFEEESILKCYSKSKIEHCIGGKGLSGDTLRFFVKQDIGDDEWQVVLIDPNHLVATEKYKEEYNSYKNYQSNINEIKNTYM